MFFVFGKCPFLLRWKNVLSGSHALHLRFTRNKSVTSTVISVNRPFIIRYTSGVIVRFSRYMSGARTIIALLPGSIPIARTLSGRGDKFCHRITKFCIF